MSLLQELREEYNWVIRCMEEMAEKPDIYTEEDHYGLPLVKSILESIAEKAKVHLS